MPGVGDHYLARSGVNSQKADIEIEADRPDDLFAPVDDDEDHGSHGIFDDVAGGVLQPKFLRSLPKTLLDLLRSIRARIVEVRARRTGP